MPKIIKIQHVENHTEYAVVHALLDDGTEAEIFCGGAVECFFHRGKIKAHVKRAQSIDKMKQ